MPTILQRNPDGTVLYEQDDGSIVTLPEYAVPPDAIGAGSPGQPSGGAPPPPDPGPVPDVAWQQPEIEMPGETIGGADPGEIEMPGEAADTFAAGGAPPPVDDVYPPAPDAISGVAPPTAPPAPPAPPASPSAPAATPRDPYQQKAAAQMAKGAVGADLADDTAALNRATAEKLAPLEEKRKIAAYKMLLRQQELAEANAKAVQEQAAFDLREPKSSVAGTVRKILALTLGVAGQMLARSTGPNPVLLALERKAREAADARLKRYSQLGARVKATGDAIDRLGDVAKSEDQFYAMAMATEWDKYAQETKRMALQAGADEQRAQAAVDASGTLVERDKWLQETDRFAWDKEREQVKLALDAEAADTARMNAQTSRGQLALGWAGHKQRVEQDKLDNAIKLDDMRRKWMEALKTGDQQKASMIRIEWEKAKHDEERRVSFRRPVTTYGPDGKAEVAWEELKNKNGEAIRAKNDTARAKVDAEFAAVAKLIDVFDRTQELRNRYGSEVDFLKSPEWREMQVNFADAAPTWSQYKGLGVLNGPDLDLFKKAFGTDDPTEIRNIDRGLQEGRRRVLKNMDAVLRSTTDYDGPAFDIPNLTTQGLAAKADETEAGKLTREAVASAKRPGVARSAELAAAGRRGPDEPNVPTGKGGRPYVTDEVASYRPTPQEEQAIEAVAALAKSGDASARAGLANMIKSKAGAAESAAARIAVEHGIDLSPELGADEWAVIVRTLTAAKRGRAPIGTAAPAGR